MNAIYTQAFVLTKEARLQNYALFTGGTAKSKLH